MSTRRGGGLVQPSDQGNDGCGDPIDTSWIFCGEGGNYCAACRERWRREREAATESSPALDR